MFFSRRWLLLFSLLILGDGQLFAASREDRAFAAAAAEFHDEFWSRAEMDFARFVQRFSKSTNAASALLYEAQAQYKQAKYSEAIALLTDPGNRAMARGSAIADQFVLWTAEAQYAAGEFSAAASTFAGLSKSFPASPWCLRSVVEAAAAYGAAGDWLQTGALLTEEDGVFQRAARRDEGADLVVRGRLLLAQADFEQKNLAGAAAALNLPRSVALPLEMDWRREHLLYQVKFKQGDFAAALAAATNLIRLAPLRKSIDGLSVANAALGAALEKMNRLAEAVASYSENLGSAVPVAQQQEAVLKLAVLSAAQNDFTNSVASLEKFLALSTNSPALENVLLALGELHLKDFIAHRSATNQLVLAREKFEQLLAMDTNSVLAGQAFLGHGWCNWLSESNWPALADFQAATEHLPPSEEQAVAKFKTGDAQFVLEDFAAAQRSYQGVLDDYKLFPSVASSMGDRAYYQLLRVNLKLRNISGAESAARALLDKFPGSDFSDNGQLLLGEALTDFNLPGNARTVFRQFAEQFPDSPLKSQADLAVARSFERDTNWTEAIGCYASWLGKYPAHELRPQAEFALARTSFQAGDTTNAFRLFSEFVARYPTNDLAPFAQWWLADDFFRAGNFIGAETNYEGIYQNPAWQNSALFHEAQLMAGRAAMGHQSFSDAVSYFTKLLSDTNCPPELAVRVRFACVAALKQAAPADTNRPLANLEIATNLLGQICHLHPADETGVRAVGELADCAALMLDFDGATNFYSQVVNSPVAGINLRSRAQVEWAQVLERKAELLPAAERIVLLREALKNYCAVLYTTQPQLDPLWAKKAGWQALPLMLSLKEGDADRFFTRLERWLPQLKDSLEKKKAALEANKN